MIREAIIENRARGSKPTKEIPAIEIRLFLV